MEEPAINSYETFIDAESRDEIGAVNLKETGSVIAFAVEKWTARDAKRMRRIRVKYKHLT